MNLALETLNRLRASYGLPTLQSAYWLEGGKVQSHDFFMVSITERHEVLWECRDCGYERFCQLIQPIDSFYPYQNGNPGTFESDAFLVSGEPRSQTWTRFKLPDCREFLVRRILSK